MAADRAAVSVVEEAAQRAIDRLRALGERDGELLDGLGAVVRECRPGGRIVVLAKPPCEAGYGPDIDAGHLIAGSVEDAHRSLDPYRDGFAIDELASVLDMLRG